MRPFKPLTGIRVVDLTRHLPGPLATLLLSDLGAEVIKVEEPGGDPMRLVPPLLEGTAAIFHALNRGKKFVRLDLKQDAGRERILELLATADVLMEGFRPGVLPRLGLDPADLVRRFPRLNVVRISGFGSHGPWADRPGHDLNYLALAGALDRIPAPMPLPVLVADTGAALLAVISTLAALAGRRPGDAEGRVLEVPILDGALLFTFGSHARQAAGDDPVTGVGLLEGGVPTYRLYQDSEGRRVSVAAFEPWFQDDLERLFGGIDAATLQAAIGARPRRDLEGPEGGPPCVEPVLTLAESREHPAIQARAMFRTMAADGRTWALPVTPYAAADPAPEGLWGRAPGADDGSVFS